MEKERSPIPLFANQFVRCYADHLLILLYYFPYGNKKIFYHNIQSTKLVPMDQLGFFQVKMWGMALSPIWWHCDWKRQTRKSALILQTHQWPQIGLTMDENDLEQLHEILQSKAKNSRSN